jgi:hypothetical protein
VITYGKLIPRRDFSSSDVRRLIMTDNTHQTAPTQYVEADGVRFAYRRFGKAGDVPLVFNMHFMGAMDH